jgi:hypothetical protein
MKIIIIVLLAPLAACENTVRGPVPQRLPGAPTSPAQALSAISTDVERVLQAADARIHTNDAVLTATQQLVENGAP